LSSQRVDAGAVELLWAEIINYPRAGEAAAGFHYVSTTVASRRRAALIFLGANELIDWLYVSRPDGVAKLHNIPDLFHCDFSLAPY
jgi:hypothetical protein